MKKSFNRELFQNPPAPYRGAPFWSWNGALERETLHQSLDDLFEMGFGGATIHSRIGLRTPYLGEQFMAHVADTERYAASKGMLTYLYDEDKWPSGAAGGLVTKEKKYAARYLLFTPTPYGERFLDRHKPTGSRLSNNGDLSLLYRYDVTMRAGKLVSYRRLKENESGENERYAYLVVTEPLDWFNKAPYLDVLSEDAVRRFVEVTHERYKETLGAEFGKSVPSIFTDEPGFHPFEYLPDGTAPCDAGVAWTESLPDAFEAKYGYRIEDALPEIFYERADGLLSKARYEYHDCVASLFAENYAGTIGRWCSENGIALTGHLLFEESLDKQSCVTGEVMRVLRNFTIPGIDMLADRHEYTTVKQAASVAHQYGKEGVTAELYGVTNWDFDFRGHKHQGDWLAALGVTNRVPHLSWMTMSGESKRDYPSPIDAHTTWYRKYPLIEDYFARLNTVLKAGSPVVKIGVIHPIESYWMLMGPQSDTEKARKRLDRQFEEITEWLLFGHLDYDYISEAILQEIGADGNGTFCVGEMEYDAVVLPGLVTIRKTTLDALKAFRKNGGKVVFCGRVPSYVDGEASEEAEQFAKDCETVPNEEGALLDALEEVRNVRITANGKDEAGRLVYQLREDGDTKFLFLAQGKHDDRLELTHWVSVLGKERFTVAVKGAYHAVKLDPETGAETEIAVRIRDGFTETDLGFYTDDSALLAFTPAEYPKNTAEDRKSEAIGSEESETLLFESYLPNPLRFSLSEPNVLLLDEPEFSLDGGAWQEREEILKIDERIRRTLGYRLRNAAAVQPWVFSEEETPHTVSLRYRIVSEIEIRDAFLGFEVQPGTKLFLNGRELETETNGFYVDKAIRKIETGPVCQGENELVAVIPFGPSTDLESAYLLGEFGVRLTGRDAVVTKMPEKIGFGDLSVQGFPFYGGNVTYIAELPAFPDADALEVEVTEYKGALLAVSAGQKEVDLYRDPCTARFAKEDGLPKEISITLYGTRINTFGQVHNAKRQERYWGNKTWRTSGRYWSYGYELRKTGILTAPLLRALKKN